MLLYVLCIGHFIADFFLQSSRMARLKREKFRYLLLHCGVYAIVFAAISYACLTPGYATCSFFIIILSHFVIDLIRCKIDNRSNNPKVGLVCFLIDQLLHIGVIIGVYCFLELNMHVNWLYRHCLGYSEFSTIVLYTLLFTILTFPSSVFVKKLLEMLYNRNSKTCEGEDKKKTQRGKGTSKKQKSEYVYECPNVGSMIGMLERVITSILLLCNQYSAIGLVLTAKSIARFKQLEDKDFAEKYLIGTLSSILLSLVTTLIVKRLL